MENIAGLFLESIMICAGSPLSVMLADRVISPVNMPSTCMNV